MTDAQLKDEILRLAADEDQPNFSTKTLSELLKIELGHCKKLCKELEKAELITISSMRAGDYLDITTQGEYFAKHKSYAEVEAKMNRDRLEKERLNAERISKEEEERKFRRTEVDATVQSAASSKSSASAAWLSGFFAGVTFLLAAYQFYLSFHQANEIDDLKATNALLYSKTRSLDSLVKQQQKILLQTKSRLDSLPTGTIQKKRVVPASKAS
jgi:hypothetical protein